MFNHLPRPHALPLTRRAALGLLGTAVPLLGLPARPRAATAATPLTDAVIAAARKEGTVVFHTSIEVSVCEQIIAGFNKRYPDIKVQLERTGAERILQRINQEYSSGIHAADVVESSDTGMFLDWKKKGWLATIVPPEVIEFWPEAERDPDGKFASMRASLSVIAYNTKQVKPEDAPKGYADLLHPRWRMRMVKAHPSYSGSILTSTFLTARAMGWDYMEKLGKQRVMQVQSATEPPKKVGQGERSVEVDGSEYVVLNMQDAGIPIAPVYSVEGTPVFTGPACLMEKAAHPNAGRVFYDYLFSLDCQQRMADPGNLRSFHKGVKVKAGHTPLSDIKLLSATPEDLVAHAEDTKRKYLAAFGV